MKIHLDRYFNFYTQSDQSWVETEISEPARLSDVLARLGIPIAEVHMVVVNGEAFDPKDIFISKQDKIKLFPPFGGG
jgi:sulfur carrier protein ThiS